MLLMQFRSKIFKKMGLELTMKYTQIDMTAMEHTIMVKCVDFIDDLGMNSITFITLIIELEVTFDIIVPDELLLMENFRNVNDIIDFVTQQ